MRTARVEMVVARRNGSVIFSARSREEEPIEISLSPTRAFSFYQVLMGRRKSESSRRTEKGKTIFFSIFSELRKEGEEKEPVETGYKIIHLREEGGRKFGYSVGVPGRLLLAHEFRNTISDVLESGGGIEVAKDGITCMVFEGRMRLVVGGEIVRVGRKTVTVLKNLLLARVDANLGEIEVKGGKFFIKGSELTPEQENTLRGLIEVFP